MLLMNEKILFVSRKIYHDAGIFCTRVVYNNTIKIIDSGWYSVTTMKICERV